MNAWQIKAWTQLIREKKKQRKRKKESKLGRVVGTYINYNFDELMTEEVPIHS